MPRVERIANPAEEGTLVRATEAGSACCRALPPATEVVVRTPLHRTAAASLGVVLGLVSPACSDDDPLAPTTGEIRVQIATSGNDLDNDGYEVVLENVGQRQLQTNSGLVSFASLTPGTYVVELAQLAGNCQAAGENPRAVSVVAGRTATVSFNVACDSRLGTLRVTVATTGEELDEDGYWVVVNGDDYAAVPAPANGVVTIEQVHEGPAAVTLTGVVENCAAAASPASAFVPYLGATDIAVAVTCAPTGSIHVTTSTAGADQPGGYTLAAYSTDGSRVYSGPITASGERTFAKLPGEEFHVRLDGGTENCTIAAGRMRQVTVEVRATSEIVFDVTCAAARRLVFATREGASADIATVKSNGADYALVSAGSADDDAPDWSPDGTRVVFVSTRDGNGEIYTMNADGSGVTRLTSTPGDDRDPAWSPAGDRIAWAGRVGENQDLYVMNADGSGVVRLTTEVSAEASPAWSPDGSRLAYSTTRHGNEEIYVINADGSGPTRLTIDDASDLQPSWSPDGARLAFVSNRCLDWYCYSWHLMTMTSTGSGVAQLQTYDVLADPVWSPDGEWLAFATSCNYYCYYTTPGLMLARADGSDGRLVREGPISSPSWRR
jgi:dipeptidyl aminopeptidase/acylaminoacyl peptidase